MSDLRAPASAVDAALEALRARVEDVETWQDQVAVLNPLVARLSDQIRVAGSAVRDSSVGDAGRDSAAKTVQTYRKLLLRAAQAFKNLETNLVGEKVRLVIQRRHLQAARNWTAAHRDTVL